MLQIICLSAAWQLPCKGSGANQTLHPHQEQCLADNQSLIMTWELFCHLLINSGRVD
jgi:hypothetical protein